MSSRRVTSKKYDRANDCARYRWAAGQLQFASSIVRWRSRQRNGWPQSRRTREAGVRRRAFTLTATMFLPLDDRIGATRLAGDDAPGTFATVIAGERVTLFAERALFWPRERTLFVADV